MKCCAFQIVVYTMQPWYQSHMGQKLKSNDDHFAISSDEKVIKSITKHEKKLFGDGIWLTAEKT